jgi:hypothetical protein
MIQSADGHIRQYIFDFYRECYIVGRLYGPLLSNTVEHRFARICLSCLKITYYWLVFRGFRTPQSIFSPMNLFKLFDKSVPKIFPFHKSIFYLLFIGIFLTIATLLSPIFVSSDANIAFNREATIAIIFAFIKTARLLWQLSGNMLRNSRNIFTFFIVGVPILLFVGVMIFTLFDGYATGWVLRSFILPFTGKLFSAFS